MRQRIGKMLFILFTSGIAVGILAAFFLRGYFLDEFDTMQEGLLKSLDEKLYSRVGLFMFLFWQRIKQTFFFLFMLMTGIGLPFLYTMTVFAGTAGGCYLFACCCRYGISGTIVFLAGFLPQGICYFLLLCLLIKQGLGNRGGARKAGTAMGNNGKMEGSAKRKMRCGGKKSFFAGGLIRILLGMMLLLLGCFVETCFNPPLLQWILHLAG